MGWSEDDGSSDKEVAGEGPGVSQVRWEPRALPGVVRGGGREEGVEAAVGSGVEAAIIFATEALEWHARGTAGDGKRFESWRAFVKELKSKFCPQTVEYNVLHTLQSLRVQGELPLLCESIRVGLQAAEWVEEG